MKELLNMTLIMMLLGICTYFDIKEKKIPIFPILLCVIASVGVSVYEKDFSIASFVVGLFIGIVFCGFSLLSKGGIGLGDGMLAGACGICIGFYETLGLFFFGFLLTGIVGLVLMAGWKKEMKAELPLVPFLYVAYSILCFFSYK